MLPRRVTFCAGRGGVIRNDSLPPPSPWALGRRGTGNPRLATTVEGGPILQLFSKAILPIRDQRGCRR